MKIRWTDGQGRAASSAGTEDYTITDAGTPDGAIVYTLYDTTVNTDTNNWQQCIGFFDGTNIYSVGGKATNSVASTTDTRTNATVRNSDIGVVFGTDNSFTRLLTSITAITDGVRITFDSGAGTCRLIIGLIYLEGADAMVAFQDQVSGTASGTETFTTTGVDPNFIWGAGAGQADSIDTAEYDGGYWEGYATSTQEVGAMWNDWPGASNTDTGAGLSDTYFPFTGRSGASSAHNCRITTWGTGEFVVTTDAVGASNPLYFTGMAFELDTEPTVFTYTWPLGGDFDPFTASAKPQMVHMFGRNATSYGRSVTAMSGYIAEDDGTEYCMTGMSGNGVSTSNVSGRWSNDRWINLNSTQTTVQFEANNPTFDSSGIVFDSADIATHPGSAFVGGGFALYSAGLTHYYAIYTAGNGSSASDADVKAGIGTGIVTSGSQADVAASAEQSFTATGLTANTQYDLEWVVNDGSSDLRAQTVSFRTKQATGTVTVLTPPPVVRH